MRLVAIAVLSGLFCACSPKTIGVLLDIRKLKSSDPAARRDAAEDLGRKMDRKAVDPLIAALRDRDEGVRRAAAKALGVLGDPRAVAPILARFPTEDKYTQQDFADALGALKDPRAAPALFAAVKTQDEFGRKHMSDALGNMGAAAIPGAVAGLRDPDVGIRQASAVTLVGIAYKIRMGVDKSAGTQQQMNSSALPALIAALRDPAQQVRSESANALHWINNPSAIGPLIALFHDPDDDVREADASSVTGFGDDALGPLLAALRDPDPNLRIGAARALGNMAWVEHSERAAAPLLAGVGQGNLEIAAGAYSFLIARGDAASEPVLIAALERYPAKRMADEFLNSGNKTLADGVKAWAEKHGIKIEQDTRAAGTARWGKH
jgi:HEAT repeat protein